MEQLELTFRANNQCLEATNFTPPLFVASNTVDWIVAKFDLGTNWDCWSLGAVKAIWKFRGQQYSAILNAEGVCEVPHEVLGAMTGEVKVNLVASTIEDEEVVERLTTYPLYCINVNKVALIDGDNSVAITPSEYEQFVEDVQEYAQDAYDAKIGAEQAADSASNSAGIASDMADTATQAKNVAVQQAQLAVDAKEAAQTAQGRAEDAQGLAESARDSAIEAKNDAQGYAQDAQGASQSILGLQATAEVDANVGTPSVNVSVGEVGGNKVMNFAFHNLKGAQGEQGEDGADGADGFSPTVEVTPTTDGNEVTITDKDGEHSFEVLNGNIEDFYPFLPTDTAQGDIASFSDGANNVPMLSLVAEIEPIQDLHGQTSPYPAGGGKNLLNTLSTTHNNYNIGSIPNTFQPNTEYTFSVNGTTSYRYRLYLAKSSNLLNAIVPLNAGYIEANSSQPFTTPNDMSEYDVLCLAGSANGAGNEEMSAILPQVELGSTATDYAPYSNICPISGTTEVVVTRGGINQWDEVWEVGSYTASGGNGGATDRIRCKNPIPVVGGSTVYFKAPTNNYVFYLFFDANMGALQTSIPMTNVNTSLSVPQEASYMLFCLSASYGTTYNHDISINYPSTDHDYHSYITPLTITTALGQTVYGGTVDVVSGKLTVDRAMVTFDGSSDEDWGLQNGIFRTYAPADIKTLSSASSTDHIVIADRFKSVGVKYRDAIGDGEIAKVVGSNRQIGCYSSAFASIEDFVASLATNPMTVVYELATPTVIQLTPQEVTSLLGGNTVWADSGNVAVTYKADIQRYIDKKISAVLNA